MRQKRFLERAIGSLTALLLLAGCGGAFPGPTATHSRISPTTALVPIPASTPIPPAATSEPAATGPATLAAAQPSSTSVDMPKVSGAAWHLVLISESSGWGLGSAYADQIEKDVGVKVILDDFAVGDLSAADVLDALETGTSAIARLEDLPVALRNAEVVVLFPGPMRSIHADTFLSIRKCFGNVMGTPEPCPADGFDEYTADLEAIWAKVFELRSGKPTILRALDDASPFVGRWNEARIFAACTMCWECYSAAARRAAEAFQIPFLSRYDVYNGADHELDPNDQGYIGADGIHPNALAQQHTAQLLSKLGYEAVIPRRR